MAEGQSHPVHLDPSELGTKEYWDKYYQNDLDNDEEEEEDDDDVDEQSGRDDDDDDHKDINPPDPSDLESWFDDVGAPAKTLAFLTSSSFPLSPNYTPPSSRDGDSTASATAKVLDLGTGNGSALFALRLQGQYAGPMFGVDYSAQSIELARRLHGQYEASAPGSLGEMHFEVLDLIHDSPEEQSWWPRGASGAGGFDLVLDKGTFDAISLSSATVRDPTTDTDRRICELYPVKVLRMVAPGGFLLVTSCNWTEEEVVSWFTGASVSADGDGDEKFEVDTTIKYPVFQFGGQKGQGVASVCFKKTKNGR